MRHIVSTAVVSAKRDPLALLEEGRRALAEAVTVDEVRNIRTVAAAAETYTRQRKLSLEAQNHASELRVRAERRLGELLDEGQRSGVLAPRHRPTEVSTATTLPELGLSRDDASKFKALAAVPETEFESYIADTKESGERITSSGARMAVHYSSATPEWATPQRLFDDLDAEFQFNTDVCATEENAKCPHFFTAEDDGLAQEWTGTCWMNPPYGDVIPAWVAKARDTAEAGHRVVALLPARVDTGWWWDNCTPYEIRFIRGRLKFGGGENSAPFPSAVVVFGDRVHRVVWWPWR